MATQKPDLADVSRRFLNMLLREREVRPRAHLIAERAAAVVPDGAAVVYLLETLDDSPYWVAKALIGDIHMEEAFAPFESGALGVLGAERKPVLRQSANLVREDYAHLHTSRTVVSLACVPIPNDEELIGAIEVLSFSGAVDRDDVTQLMEIAEQAGAAFVSARAYEDERNTHLSSISRLAQLYDLEKVFNSTLEMDALLPIIASKFREVLDVQAVNIWMVKDDSELLLMSQAGEDPTVSEGAALRAGEGLVSEVSDSGEAKFTADPADPYLVQRNAGLEEPRIFSLMAAPLMVKEEEVGVVEVLNKQNGIPFDDDDLFFLISVAETAAAALNNAALLQAERKVEILETLVKVSTEITSTLNLDRVLHAVVTMPSAVVGYERAAIALEERGKLRLRAVSGMDEVQAGDPDVERLRELLDWVSISSGPLHISQHENEINADREETRAKFERYFAESGMRGFYALPLADDEGRVGVLCFESSDPDFLSEAHTEMIRVLAGQATVALRNASLYTEVPFIGVLEPFLQKKQKFLAMEKRRRALLLVVCAAAVLFLAVFPIPMRVDGDAVVEPLRSSQVQPAVGGVISKVYVHEGEHVSQGQILADLQDWPFRAALAVAQAKFETANLEMSRALAANEGTEAGMQRVQADYWGSEVERARRRLESTHLRTMINGWVATPHIEEFVGRAVKAGDTVVEVADNSETLVDVAIPEQDVNLLRVGESGALKLDSSPTRTFHGKVSIVSPKAEAQGDDRFFYARVTVPNPAGRLLAGMHGRGKLYVGWRPVGYVLFRRPAMWIYSKLWSWFGW